MVMAAFIGVGLALLVSVFARVVGLDRDRAFYPTVLAVIAVLYDLFAVMGGSTRALLLELAVGSLFLVAVAVGFRRSLWIVAAGLFAHGVYDFLHPFLFANPGVPAFWPAFCAGYDVAAAAWLAVALQRDQAPSLR
jgi:hypothetical protein